MSEPRELLRLSGAAFGYAGQAVVRGVELVVREGDVFGLVGANGAGKTTLLRGLLGLVSLLDGELRRATSSLGYVPQRESLDALFPLTVREVVEMSFRGRRFGQRRIRPADRERCSELLGRVGLLEKSESAFASLSGGQRQRALIARALVLGPELLVLDEPTSGVDRETNASIVRLLRELQAEGVAILIVSHNFELIREETRKVLRVTDGRVEELAPEELTALGSEQPADALGLGTGARS